VFALANVLERQGKVIDALTNYRAAIMLDPHNNPQYYTAYARLLQKEGQVTEAIVIMRTILDEYTPAVIENRALVSISQRLAVGYALLADLNIEKGDLGKAQQAIDRAEDLSPNNAFVQQVKATLQAAQE
jgi:tetratricopeptide (TPR) repeat protein